MPDMRKLVLAESIEVREHPLVIGAMAEAAAIAKRDGFHGIPEYDFLLATIESVKPSDDKWAIV